MSWVAAGQVKAAPAEPGARVRVTILARGPVEPEGWHSPLEPGTRIIGTLHSIGADSIRLRDALTGKPRVLSRAIIGSIEQSVARPSRAGRGALMGFLAGAAVGTALGVYVEHWENEEGSMVIAIAGPAALAGLALGAGIGSLSYGDTWSSRALPADATDRGTLPPTPPAMPPAMPSRSALRPGDHLRLVIFDEPAVTGRLVSFDSRSLELLAEPDSLPRLVPFASIATLEVGRPRTRAGRGATLGFLAGGALAVAWAGRHRSDGEIAPAAKFITGSMIGTIVGAAIGRRSRYEKWKGADLP